MRPYCCSPAVCYPSSNRAPYACCFVVVTDWYVLSDNADKYMAMQGILFAVCASPLTLSVTKSACVLAVEKSYSHRSGSRTLLAHSALAHDA